MKKEEEIAYNFLRRSGFSGIRHEPDGNIPPDFSMNDEIGVEVRRLSQLYFFEGGYKSLEEDSIPFVQAIDRCLEEFDEDKTVDSYWIVPDYERPLEEIGAIKRNLREVLNNFLSGNLASRHDIPVAKNIRISIAKRANPTGQRFRIGFEIDNDGAGWVNSIYLDTVNKCIEEKKNKIHPYLDKYKRWWLVFIDMIVAIPAPDTIAIVQKISKPPEIDRVIFIDPTSADKTFEL